MSGELVPLRPHAGVRTPRAKAARMREMVLALIHGISDVEGLPMAFMALRPFIPILAAKLKEVDDDAWLTCLASFEDKLHYVKTGDPPL